MAGHWQKNGMGKGILGVVTVLACLAVASCDSRSSDSPGQGNTTADPATESSTPMEPSTPKQPRAPVASKGTPPVDVDVDDGTNDDEGGGDISAPDVDPGALGDVHAVVLSPTTAKLVWTTAGASDSELRWGKTPRLEAKPILQPNPTRVHTVLLKSLEPGKKYYAQAVSRGLDSTVESEVISFDILETENCTVRKTHPRILFNSDDIPVIQKRVVGSHSRSYKAMIEACESKLSSSAASIAKSGKNEGYAMAYAFIGYFSNKASFRDKAVDIALECAKLGSGGEKMSVRLRLQTLALVYDWLHSTISESNKSKLKKAMLAMFERLDADSNKNEFVWGHSHGNSRPMVLAALALHGESPTITARLDDLLEGYRNGFFSTWRNYGESEGGSLKGWGYTTWTLSMEVDVLASVRSATNVDWYKTEAWYEKLVDWYIMGMRSDSAFLRSGDSQVGVGFNYFDWSYALSVAHFYKNPRAKWLAEHIAEKTEVWALHNVYDILWNDPELDAEPPSGSGAKLYQTAGHVLLRDSWKEDAVIADFRSASDYTLGHTHLDNNSFTIFHRGGLALDSGIYDDFSGSHHMNYYRRTVAHNSVLVFDPNEKFVLYGDTYSNDGGQRWRNKADGLPATFPASVEDTLDPSNGYRAGGIQVYEDTEEHTYALGDAASSYSKKKLQVFDRHFLWLKSAGRLDKPVIVVFDHLESPKGNFKKKYLLHTQNAPTVKGSLVTAANGGGVLFQQTILPSSAKFEVVGGSGKEFFVDGRNYKPTRSPAAREEGGKYRVEVSAPSTTPAEEFLHVLYATAEGRAVPPRTAQVNASGMQGCTVEDWTVLFGTRQSGTVAVQYMAVKGASKHLLLGMVPNAAYKLKIDGVSQGEAVASTRGTLRFDVEGSGNIAVRRSSATGVPGA
ncbi:MAG TPA: heparinase II/III family protein [Planctomycetota bacterium]|nr:heparinase II/III family protein [Planctomycetota bacterium]